MAYTSGCANVATSLVYLRTAIVDTTGKLDTSRSSSTLSRVAFWWFDDDGQVLRYQAWIPNLQAWTETATGMDFGSAVVQKAALAALSPAIQSRCNGTDQQYLTEVEYTAELELKPFGDFDEAGGDNVVCRTIHLISTQVRTEVHCLHVGPHGGNGRTISSARTSNINMDYFDDALLFGSAEELIHVSLNKFPPLGSARPFWRR